MHLRQVSVGWSIYTLKVWCYKSVIEPFINDKSYPSFAHTTDWSENDVLLNALNKTSDASVRKPMLLPQYNIKAGF
jgi:hypothetical protein